MRGDDRDAYFNDAMELLRICDVLGIDITKEDPHDYQAEDIAKLKITYIVKNREYLEGAMQRNLNVLSSLSAARVSDYITKPRAQVSITTQVMNTVQAILDCDHTEIRQILEGPPDTRFINKFFRTYASVAADFMITKKQHMSMMSDRSTEFTDPEARFVPVLGDFLTQDGFLCSLSRDATLQLFRVGRYTSTQYGATVAIAHVSGHLFLATGSNDIYYLHVLELEEYINDCQHGRFSERYDGNRKYGVWHHCFA